MPNKSKAYTCCGRNFKNIKGLKLHRRRTACQATPLVAESLQNTPCLSPRAARYRLRQAANERVVKKSKKLQEEEKTRIKACQSTEQEPPNKKGKMYHKTKKKLLLNKTTKQVQDAGAKTSIVPETSNTATEKITELSDSYLRKQKIKEDNYFLGKRIDILWEGDKKYFRGTVVSSKIDKTLVSSSSESHSRLHLLCYFFLV